MVRQSGTSSQRVAAPMAAGNPPPSTIAAQIVNNAANNNGRQDLKIPFPELLREFLRNPIIDDLDPHLNVQFISTIVEAGLDSLHQNNPFTLDRPQDLAIDSIRAIDSSIWQIPSLLNSSRSNTSNDCPQPPVFLWLFPKLLALLDPLKFEPLHVHLQDLLNTCLAAASQTSSLWEYGVSLVELYRSCVDNILLALQASDNLPKIPGSNLNISLPPVSNISDLWPESRNLVALPQGCQTTITSRAQAVLTGLQLIHSLLDHGKGRPVGERSGVLGPPIYISWALDRNISLWRILRHWHIHTKRSPLHDGVEAAFMQVLDAAAFPRTATEEDFSYSPKAAIFILSTNLADLIGLCSSLPFSISNQTRLASLLTRLRGLLEKPGVSGGIQTRRSRDLKPLITDTMAPVIMDVCQNVTKFSSLQKDLQLALCLWTAPGKWPTEINELRDSLCSDVPTVFADDQLQTEFVSFSKVFRELNLEHEHEERAPKKLKRGPYLDEYDPSETYRQLVMRVNGSTPESPNLELSGRHNSIVSLYEVEEPQSQANQDEDNDIEMRDDDAPTPTNGENARCELLLALGKMACAGSQCLLPPSQGNSRNWKDMTCCLCDNPQPGPRGDDMYWDRGGCGDDWKEVIAAILAIVALPNFRESTRPRILMALTIRRIFNHISDAEYLDLQNSTLGEWLLASMSRSLRELRISAVQSLMVFLRNDMPQSVRGTNRRFALEFFHTLSQQDALLVHETLIMAYGRAASVCGEDELPIILLQLVEYLGHTNALICSMAYNELRSIAESSNQKPVELLRPFWRSIGVSVCRDLRSKPQKAQLLSDLTEQNITNLLLSTQAEILPHLVLTKRNDILEQIATARTCSIQDVFFQPQRHLANILALLLCQPGANVEQSTMDALVAVSPAFGGSEYGLSDYVKYEPVIVACEILKSAADQHESKKAQYQRGFRTLAALAETKKGQKKTEKKKMIESFFDVHLLGIMAHFSEILDSVVSHPLVEKKRCVGAISEMISIAGNCVSSALPQIRACLQSAMADSLLCDQTLQVWFALLGVLDEEDIELVVDQTFALIAQNWESFADETQIATPANLGAFVTKHNQILNERIASIPSLASIPMLSKLESELSRLKSKVDKVTLFIAFSRRCSDENAIVVRQALKELLPFLENNQKVLHEAAISQKLFPALPALTRSLLDACVRFAEDHEDIPILCARCLGVVGGLDPYKVETVREKKHILVLSNFERLDEVIDFCAFLLERVLVKVFHSTTNARAQGFLGYVMQELLRACGFNAITVQRPRLSQPSPALRRWVEIPEAVRNTLTPLLNSRYLIRGISNKGAQEYPIFTPGISHSSWLRAFVYDLLQSGKGENAKMIFPALARIIKGHDLSIATFILPFAVLNLVITGNENETTNIGQELLMVLQSDFQTGDQTEAMKIKQCSENVFQTLDYLALWLQEKRKALAQARAMAGKTGRGISETDELRDISAISCVERILQMIPAEVISRRAVDCGSYARALYHWEEYYRQEQQKSLDRGAPFAKDNMLQNLQYIYAQIDDPDGIAGISAHLQVLNPDQQIMEHRKAGRWTAAQSWYELSLAEKPNDTETQLNLLTCLKESGQYDSILNYIDGFQASNTFSPNTLPFAAEAAWSTGKWDHLERMLASSPELSSCTVDFNVGVGRALLALRSKQVEEFKQIIESLRAGVAKDLSPTSTSSLHACHDNMVKLHVLYEIEVIGGTSTESSPKADTLLDNLDRRLDVLGAYPSDKSYLLGVRRAVMQLSSTDFTKLDIASAWLTTARLARKAEFTSTAFNSVLHAAQLGDDASKIEYSKLLWKEGHHLKAIQNLQGAIASNAFQSRNAAQLEIPINTTIDQPKAGNRVKAHARLLLAKWRDRAGQTKSEELQNAYMHGIQTFSRWDKGHYYLGRHYNKLFESEKSLPPSKRTVVFAGGEYQRLVVENYIRSVVYGTKYYYQTIPKILTLWLDLGEELCSAPATAHESRSYKNRIAQLDRINAYIHRYCDRITAYAWYTAFPQIITRIAHPEPNVWDVLQGIIVRVASQYPQQALWSLVPVTNATQEKRRIRGLEVLEKLKDDTSRRRHGSADLSTLIIRGQKLTDALLAACDAPIEKRASHISLSKDLGFNMKLAPCQLVIPLEATMTASLPQTNDSKAIRNHEPFPRDAITIAGFADDVLILMSLQRPRKLTVRGSDGRSYGLLCKPKDDLRKDQRLMEFNAMINRALKRDVDSSKRRLYIKTYGVTPLNEECGTIEWVEGLKPMRDIILGYYKARGVSLDYKYATDMLNLATSDREKIGLFAKVVENYPAVLYEWFIESFPEPEAWFAARLRYTRSCAVMSIVGHVLGLGDRHGENILLEEGNGGTFHVDFNCLFDKGLTFDKPELVPFRLTHNMVDAMGPQGIEGPFRKAGELVYGQLRQHEDTLITILETFVHDPTADFVHGGKKSKRRILGVPETPQEVLECVRSKVDGIMKGETVPLSVEGYVDALIAMAQDHHNLAGMYIGWCAFF